MFQRTFFFFCLKYAGGKGNFLVLIVYQSTRSNIIEFAATLWGVDMIDTEAWRGQRLPRALSEGGGRVQISTLLTLIAKPKLSMWKILHLEVP